ncbi:MAG TPA: HEAT repeat domain-containing protein [Acidimicrobiales bacterium]|nr:HEAT repeat domain-containing protein [Acidimicrobiales bacterium]
MGKYDRVRLAPDQVAELLELTHDDDPLVRRVAAKNLCPCRMKRDVEPVWERLFEMTTDPDPGVRHDVVHALTDGSPRTYAAGVYEVIDRMRNDPDRKLRKYVRYLAERQRRLGKVNVG